MNRRDLFKGFATVVLASRIPLPVAMVTRLRQYTTVVRVRLPNAQWRRLTNGESYTDFRKGFVK